MTHRQIYNKAAKLAKQHKALCDLLAEIENEKFGFEFAETDSDPIIDTINYGTDSYSFDDYLKEMEFYAKSAKENNGDLHANGIYL